MLRREIDLVEKRLITTRISKLEENLLKYRDIEKQPKTLEDLELKVIMVKEKLKDIEDSLKCDGRAKKTKRFDCSADVDVKNTKIGYLEQKMKTINKQLEMVEKRMVVDRIATMEHNVPILCDVNIDNGKLENISREIDEITNKLDLVEKRVVVERVEQLDRRIEILDKKETISCDRSETDKVMNLQMKMKTINLKFEIIEKMLVNDRITKLERETEKLKDLEEKIEKIQNLETKIEYLHQKIDLARKGIDAKLETTE